MKKISLLPLVAAMAVAGTVQAQTGPTVTVYGQLDAFITTFDNDSTQAVMNEGARSRLGFRGEDKLNNGMTAYFELQERFFLDTATVDPNALSVNTAGAVNAAGTNAPIHRWKDRAWIGLKGNFGDVSVGGSIPTALDVIYGGGAAANQDTIADVRSRKASADTRIRNGILYRSPRLGPVQVNLSTALREQVGAATSDPHMGISANINLGNAFVELGYQRDSAHSIPPVGEVAASNMFNNFIINGGFKVTPDLEIIAALANSQGRLEDGVGVDEDTETNVYALGVKTKALGGNLTATFTHTARVNAAGIDQLDNNKAGVALSIPLSSRTEWLTAVSYEMEDRAFNGEDAQIGAQTGLRLKF